MIDNNSINDFKDRKIVCDVRSAKVGNGLSHNIFAERIMGDRSRGGSGYDIRSETQLPALSHPL